MAAPTPAGSLDKKVTTLMSRIAATMPGQVQQTLPRISGVPLQVLALRRYLRIGQVVTEKWAWTAEQNRAFELSAASWELRASINAVKQRFEADNPGYALGVAPTFRSLDRQIHNFCASGKVNRAAALLAAAVAAEVASYPETIGAAETARFTKFLKSYHFSTQDEPSVAVPGISDHGRAQAIDFIVSKEGKPVAGPSVSQIGPAWNGQGFGRMLNAAIRNSTNKFKKTHLQAPFEPWHYDLDTSHEPPYWAPASIAAAAGRAA